MLIHSASQLLTLAGGPQRGTALGTLGLVPDGAVLMRNGIIEAFGPSRRPAAPPIPDEPRLDAAGHAVMPGFVDPHTHLVWAGDRAAEFEMRLRGQNLPGDPGGRRRHPLHRARHPQRRAGTSCCARPATRAQEPARATAPPPPRSRPATGWKLQAELRQLRGLLALDDEGPLEMVPTFLGAHAIAAGIQGDPQGYTDLLCQRDAAARLPVVAGNTPASRPLPFVDVFCETGAFDLAQSRQILSTARDLGFPLKIHADEFDNLGGASLAVELGAVSADHLVKTSPADIAALGSSDTVAVALPCTPFGLADPHYTPAQRHPGRRAGLLAIASDLNPGTAWCESMQFVIALACRYLQPDPGPGHGRRHHQRRRRPSAGRIQSAPWSRANRPTCSSCPSPITATWATASATNLVETVIKKGEIRTAMPTLEQARPGTPTRPVHDLSHHDPRLPHGGAPGSAEGADLEIVRAAALLHDAEGTTPGGAGTRQPPPCLGRICGRGAGGRRLAGERIAAVQHCIRAHRFRARGEPPATLEAQCSLTLTSWTCWAPLARRARWPTRR